MRKNLNITHYLVMDLTTKPLDNIDEADYKSNHPNDEELKSLKYYPEYNELTGVNFGYFVREGDEVHMRVNSYTAPEKELLTTIQEVLKKTSSLKVSGYNLVNNDIPLLVKRFIINEMKVPNEIDIIDIKPWTTSVMDISNLWKGSAFTNVSLNEAHSAVNKFDPIIGEEDVLLNLYKAGEILLRIIQPDKYITKVIKSKNPE